MKEITKIMRFDLTMGMPLLLEQGLPVIWLMALLCTFFVIPVCAVFISVLLILCLILPLTNLDKGGFRKIYGVLPVNRKNITRGNIWYIFFLALAAELFSALLALASYGLKLQRLLGSIEVYRNFILPEMNKFTAVILCLEIGIVFFILCGGVGTLFFALYTILGAKHKTKLTVAFVVTPLVLCGLFMFLNEHDMIPLIDFSLMLPRSITPKMLTRWGIEHIICAASTVLFTEIAAARESKREI